MLGRFAFVPQRIGLGFVSLLSRVAGISAAIVGIGDAGLDAALIERMHVALAVVARVGIDQRIGAALWAQGIEHRQQKLLLLADPMGLRGDDDLVFGIDR